MKYVLGAVALTAFASPAFADTTFTNPTPITVVDAGETTSAINVSGLSGNVTNLTVTLSGLSHTWPDDLVIGLLNQTTNTGLVLFSYVGGSADVNDIDLTFDDAASGFLPESFVDSFPMVSGTYKVSNFGGYEFTSATNVSSLSGFFGGSGNGDWLLVVDDTFPADGGVIIRGWSLTFATDANAVPEPASWAMMIAGFGLAGVAMRRRAARTRVTFA